MSNEREAGASWYKQTLNLHVRSCITRRDESSAIADYCPLLVLFQRIIAANIELQKLFRIRYILIHIKRFLKLHISNQF